MKRKQDYSKLINIPVVILLSVFLPYPHPSCLQTAKAVVLPVCPIRVLWSSQVEGCALSPLSIPAPLLADKIISLQPLERERILLRSWKSYKVFPVYSKPHVTCLNPPCTALVTFTFPQANYILHYISVCTVHPVTQQNPLNYKHYLFHIW